MQMLNKKLQSQRSNANTQMCNNSNFNSHFNSIPPNFILDECVIQCISNESMFLTEHVFPIDIVCQSIMQSIKLHFIRIVRPTDEQRLSFAVRPVRSKSLRPHNFEVVAACNRG